MTRTGISRLVAAVAVGTVLTAGMGCATSGTRAELLARSRFQRYLSLPHRKALAVAWDGSGEIVSGYSYGSISTGLAVDRALEECRRRREHLDNPSECTLVAVGNRTIAEDPELRRLFGPAADDRDDASDVEPSEEAEADASSEDSE